MLQVEKRGRFITNMGFANVVTAAVDSDDKRIKGSCMVILEEGDPGIWDRGTPTKKLVHQLSSTNDPVFNLKVPASRIVGGYTIKNGVIVPNYSNGDVIEAVFRRTRVTVGLMTAAKLAVARFVVGRVAYVPDPTSVSTEIRRRVADGAQSNTRARRTSRWFLRILVDDLALALPAHAPNKVHVHGIGALLVVDVSNDGVQQGLTAATGRPRSCRAAVAGQVPYSIPVGLVPGGITHVVRAGGCVVDLILSGCDDVALAGGEESGIEGALRNSA